jgi:hypothetical protein
VGEGGWRRRATTRGNWEKGFDGFGICIGLGGGVHLELVSRLAWHRAAEPSDVEGGSEIAKA